MTDKNLASVQTSNSTLIEDFKVTPAYLKYVLVLLWCAMLLRFVDLQIMALLVEDIKHEFEFTDTQMGLLGGFAFAIFYATLGIPIAWLADRYSRRNIISIAVGVWSLMTAMCGFVTGYVSLFLARMGVGIGEAGGYPPTTSIIADYFPPEKRGVIFSVLASAVPMGVFAGFIIGGNVNEYYGWRTTFMVVGIPGVIFALLIRFTLREPPRGFSEKKTNVEPAPPFFETVKFLFKLPAYRHIVIAACISVLGAYGSGYWIPAFFIRHHGMGSAEVGTWMGIIYGGGGLIGTLLGGWLADHYSNKTGDSRWYVWICCISLFCILPFSLFVYLWPDPKQALMVHCGTTILMHMNMGPILAMVQGLAGVRRRAMGQAMNLLFTNMIALTLGPLIVGYASDIFTPKYGDVALGYCILGVVLIAYNWAAVHFYLASRTIREDLEVAANS